MEQRRRQPKQLISIDGFLSPSAKSRTNQAPRRRPTAQSPKIHAVGRRPMASQRQRIQNPSQQTRITPIGDSLLNRTSIPVTVKTSTNRPQAPIANPEPPRTRQQEPRPAQAVQRKRKSSPSKRRTIIRSASVLAVLVLMLGGWLGFKFLSNTSKVFGGNIASNLTSLFKPVPLKGQESGRVNILLAGNSADDEGHNGALLTDSIMLVSVDLEKNKAMMMSIPRDLWVDIPDTGHRKINEAYYWGETNEFSENGYPAGGMGLLAKTVEESFGMPINYYGLVNYTAFRDAVNAVGGINVTIKSSDPRGLYDPSIDYVTRKAMVKLANGPQQLDGQAALNLARARGNAFNSYGYEQSDFTRTANQRLMMIALKDKAASAGTLSNPVKVSSLLDAFGNNVKTDFKLNELMTLQSIVKKIPSNDIQSIGLVSKDRQLLKSYTTPAGQSALIPADGIDDFTGITAFVEQAITGNVSVSEAPTSIVLNGTETTGLAKKNQTTLVGKGFAVLSIGDATNKPYTKTTIIDQSEGKKPKSKQNLAKLYPNATFTTQKVETASQPADFVVIIGNDLAASGN